MIQKLAAEGLGTAMLLISVIGSGIMGAALSGGNDAIALHKLCKPRSNARPRIF